MANIRPINDYMLECVKGQWTAEDRFLASCLDIQENENGSHIVDVRIVSKQALNYYLTKVFPYIMVSPSQASFRVALFNNLKAMYQKVYNDFMTTFYPKAGYMEAVGRDLYDHQKETLSASIHRKNNLWALDMGTGKTLTAATMSKITKARRTIIVCPSLVKYNWLEDMTKYWGFNSIYWSIIDAKRSKTIKAFQERFVVLNFEQVQKNLDYLLADEVSHVIIDEAHYLKNHKSGRAKAVATLLKESNEPRLTMLTGTPVTNRINDMFNYLRMSGHPLGYNFAEFKRQYAVSTSGPRGKVVGAKNIPDLKGKISNLMIRLRSEDCLELPDIIMKNYYFDKSEIGEEYEEELQNLRDKKERYDSLHGVEKQKMSYEIKANIHTLNRIVATSKVNKIKALVDHLNDLGEKVVVFAGYKAPLQKLEEMFGKSCVKVDGSVDSHKRLQLINTFKEKDYCKVFLGNTQAAGIGINLVNAAHVIFINFPFTPDQVEQARKRLHRGGQKRKVHVYHTIVKDTVDEHIYSLVADKSGDINALIDGDHKHATNYNDITGQLFKKLLEQ